MSQYKTGKASLSAQGKRRYDKKQAGAARRVSEGLMSQSAISAFVGMSDPLLPKGG